MKKALSIILAVAMLLALVVGCGGGDEKDPVKARRFAAEQQRLYEVHGKENILHDPYYNPNLTMDREDFSESDDLRGLKEGRITVQWRE